MTSTIQSSKNTFEEGLIMDLSPIHTPANSMTSALNATFITYNGNEMSLQNDMGNGRIETARLPEGYIPVGTCEFGDIIYIISYNPLDNKAQIGCFPSPERNISSDEISDLKQILSYEDFQDCDANKNPTGTFKKTVIKKVLLDSKKLNPGDKYIIYSQDSTKPEVLKDNASYLSDYYKDGPKAIKLHVVSIEDSGKITYLDTTTKWYGNFYIKDGGLVNADGNSDLDSYRSLVSSEWSIFNSKTSGKLAILAELETIDSFSCSYILDKDEDSNVSLIEDSDVNFPNIIINNYKLSLEIDYFAKAGIVLPAVCITDATFPYSSPPEFPNTPGSDIYVKYRSVNNGTEHYPALQQSLKNTCYKVVDPKDPIYVDNFAIPFKETYGTTGHVDIKSESFIYNMSIVPTMGKIEDGNTILYGKLDHLAINLTIDFNKIGSGISELNTWKYHNSDNTSVFTFGLFSDPKPGYEIKFVQIDFYDNQGHVAQYLLNDKKSYNGIFTEYFTLNSVGSNTRLSRYKLKTNNLQTKQVIKNTNDLQVEIIKHKAEEISEDEKNRLSEDDYVEERYTEEGSTEEICKYYRNDAGTLYSNALYAAKITIWQATKSGNQWDNSQVFYRWYWTNTMFNDNYYDTQDFDILPFNLALDSKTAFATTENYKWEEKKINNLYNSCGNDEHYNTYSANVQHIGTEREDNLKMYIIPGLVNDYGCFNLLRKEGEDDGLKNNIKVKVYLGTENINYNLPEELYSFSNESTNITESEFLSITPKTKFDVTDDINAAVVAPDNPLSINVKDIELENDYTIKFGENIKAAEETLQNDDDQTVTYLKWEGTLEDCYYYTDDDKKGLPLNLQAILYNKAYTQEISQNSVEVPVYTPIINSVEDFANLGLGYKIDTKNHKIKMGLMTAMNIMHHEGTNLNKFSGINFIKDPDTDNHPFEFVKAADGTDDAKRNIVLGNNHREVNTATDGPFIEAVWNPIKESMGNFFLVYPGGNSSVESLGITRGKSKEYFNIVPWKVKNFQIELPLDETKNQHTAEFSIKKVYDISTQGEFESFSDNNMVAFLGIKHKDGFTLLNSAFHDKYLGKETDRFTQNAIHFYGNPETLSTEYVDAEFKNFAYQLYLIFSNTYHKNKQAEEKQFINIRNNVSVNKYEAQLTKDIIVKLSAENLNNIVFRSYNFNDYKNEIIKNLEESLPENFKNSNNITLKFLDSAVNNVLSINYITRPLYDEGENVNAYIQRNGQLKPCEILADNVFYIYQNNKLQLFSNGKLEFDPGDVDINIKYLFTPEDNQNIIRLDGLDNLIKVVLDTPEKLYLEYFLEAFKNYKFKLDGVTAITPFGYLFEIEYPKNATNATNDTNIKKILIDKIIEEIHNNINPVYIEGIHKNDILTENLKDRLRDKLMSIYKKEDKKLTYMVYIYKTVGDIYENQNLSTKDVYTFNTDLNLTSYFDYDNEISIKKDAYLSYFGIVDTPFRNYPCSFTGFIKDIVLDRTFQVI